MIIQFNEVTWYSKLLAAIVVFGVIPTLAFYIGSEYSKVKAGFEVESTYTPFVAEQNITKAETIEHALPGENESFWIENVRSLASGEYEVTVNISKMQNSVTASPTPIKSNVRKTFKIESGIPVTIQNWSGTEYNKTLTFEEWFNAVYKNDATTSSDHKNKSYKAILQNGTIIGLDHSVAG